MLMAAVVLATAGYDHKIRFWEASSRVCTRTIRYPDSQVNCLAISHDKLYIAAGGHPHVELHRNFVNIFPSVKNVSTGPYF